LAGVRFYGGGTKKCLFSFHFGKVDVILNLTHELHERKMPRKVSTEPIKRLTVELPESEYNLLEAYCLERQESKRQVIRALIQRLQRGGTKA
jgi:hypothetical protein